jgi:hypothetical protein
MFSINFFQVKSVTNLTEKPRAEFSYTKVAGGLHAEVYGIYCHKIILFLSYDSF